MGFFQVQKSQRRVILAVTFGNILEWFEIYLYAYWSPILSRVFFDFHSQLLNMFGAFLIFGTGFLARPFGAILFGRIGDLIGRKKSYLLSIILMTIPTFLIGCLPTYSLVGIWAPILLCLLRLLQSIPAAGEVPGTICFLYENADASNRRYITSWTAVGNQIGAILGVMEAFLMKWYFSDPFLLNWGWRISFWIGAVIGLFGIYLRRTLYETPEFRKLRDHHKLDKETIFQVINSHKNKIWMVIALTAINASTFYLLATYLPTHYTNILKMSPFQNAMFYLVMLILTTVLIPIFGKLGDKYSNKSILIACATTIIALLYPISYSINAGNLWLFVILSVIYILPITCLTALLAFWMAHLFPTGIRFTCVGLSFNISDGIIGGFTPAISLLLFQLTGDPASFCWYILVCALVSLGAYCKLKE